MPLQWLGQLKPSMQLQIALRRTLLALQREDEQIRAKTMPQPALARGLGGGVQPYAGPTPTIGGEGGGKFTGTYATPHFRPGAGSLEEALRAAQPSPGYVSGEERARLYREKMAGEKEALAGKAGEFWARIEPLDDAGEKVALDACKRYQPDLYRAMIEQGYVDKTTGAAVRTEVVKKPMTRDTHIEDGWLYEDVLYDDGTSTHDIIGRAEEVEAEAPSVSDVVALERLGLDIKKFDAEDMKTALKYAGDIPRVGIDNVTDENGDTRPATQTDVDSAMQGVIRIYNLLQAQKGVREVATEGEATMSTVEREFNASSAEGKMAIQAKLGVPQTGEWDEATAFAMETYGEILLGTKEPVKKEPTEEEKLKARTNLGMGGAL